MDNLSYLFAAYTLIWVVVFVYIFTMARKQRGLQREIKLLKESMDKKKQSGA